MPCNFQMHSLADVSRDLLGSCEKPPQKQVGDEAGLEEPGILGTAHDDVHLAQEEQGLHPFGADAVKPPNLLLL